MKMPFGKHKGEEISDLPATYLEWLIENVAMDDKLETAVLEARGPAAERDDDPFNDWREDDEEDDYAEYSGIDPEWYKS